MTPGVETPVGRLSGGNVQKVLLGREIALSPSVLIVAYPVRGLDINSSYRIYELLNEQKKKGVAVIFIGEDLDVLIELSDRIMVLCGGKVSGIVDPRSITARSKSYFVWIAERPKKTPRLFSSSSGDRSPIKYGRNISLFAPIGTRPAC